MTEIKFRAWDIRAREMITPAIELTETHDLIKCFIDPSNPFAYFDGLKWMQYTGLNTKENVEIFEGDILGAVCINNTIADAEVRFIFGKFIVEHKTREANICDLVDVFQNYSVIGNIYETTETKGS